MSKDSCILKPEAPNGDASRLYRDLLKRLKDRPLANLVYAIYNSYDNGKEMDKAGYIRNTQGQHNVEDVVKFLDVNTMVNDIGTLDSISFQEGTVDSNGKLVDFDNAKTALEKADNMNDRYKGLASTVVQHDNIFNVITNERNSRTLSYMNSVKEKLKIWDIYKQAFKGIGVDIDSLPQETHTIINAMNSDLATYIKNLSQMDISYIGKKDAMVLFSLNPSSKHVSNIVNEFGSIEEAAQAFDDFNHGAQNLTVAQMRLLGRAIKDSQEFKGLNIDALVNQVSDVSNTLVETSPYKEIKEELHRLNKEYNIDINEIHRISDKINTLSEAATDAIFVLERQIRLLRKKNDGIEEGKKLSKMKDVLMKELNNKKYYSGLLDFLNEAAVQVKDIDGMIEDIPQSGTEMEKIFARAKTLQNIKILKSQYYNLVDALSNDNMTIDESISKAEIDNLRKSAKELKDFFDKKENMINRLTEDTMIDLVRQFVGDTAPDGQAIANTIRMAAADSSLSNFLYSVGRASNTVVAAMGSIIRDAEDSRDGKINSIALKIRQATGKLYKAGYSSEFMYEDEGHIISDIDWSAYNTARKAAIANIKKQGLKDFDFQQALQEWEEDNTEDRIVDKSNGRTEKVPNVSYHKSVDFRDGWSKEQNEYYDTMMQLKGEIGSMLPAYAQHQYLPPQIRRNFVDAVNKAKNIKDVFKAAKNKMQNLYKVREDDSEYASNGIIDGSKYDVSKGDFNNTPLRQIPIFFVNRVEQGELLKDFSSGLQHLAGTAINYDVMNSIVDVCEFMSDFVNAQPTRDKNAKIDLVQDKMVRIFTDLKRYGRNNNTSALMEGFIAQHIYGQHIDPDENKTWSKIFGKIVGYSSFKSLATNVKGAFANYLMGEFQMMIEAGAGEFYGFKDYAWAHTRLFGKAGAMGDIAELLTNNISHKSVLMRELFDPLQENFSDKSHSRYYRSMFRQLLSKDCSFIGYSSGEYLIHYVNMYSVLHNKKVKLDGKTIPLYNAFEVSEVENGNSKLVLKKGVTDLDGNPLTNDYINKVRKTIRYVNQSTHGAMNAEDKGLLHQRWWGRGIMQFRQWMVEHYSRRFRKAHFDATLGENREGYYVSLYKGLMNDDTKDTWKKGKHKDAIVMFLKDFSTFMLRSQANWNNLNEMQKYNIKRVRAEMLTYICLLGLSFTLGEPDEHKKEFWRRWWIYQTKRAIMDTEVSMPIPQSVNNALTILQSPMSAVNTMSSMMYVLLGLTNGDLLQDIKSGPHKGENRYWRNIVKYDLPFFKDWEQMQNMDTDEAVFKVFETTPSNH